VMAELSYSLGRPITDPAVLEANQFLIMSLGWWME
jgi:hypothetical protein